MSVMKNNRWAITLAACLIACFVVLEEVADMALRTISVNSGAGPISQALLDKHFFRKHGGAAYYGQVEK